MASVLIIDDNETIREGVAAVVAKEGHKVHVAADGEAGWKAFCSRRFDFTITDLKMQPIDGLEVLRRILERDEDAVVMMMTAFGSVETAVDAMKLGAFDFITKPFKPDVLRAKLDSALEVARVKRERTRLQAENQLLRQEVQGEQTFASMVGESAGMESVFATLRKVGPTDSSVLITGESGTGKELVAKALHELSRRKEAAFIPVNCGALAETLLESEMFGYEKGAFTGANRRKLGRFELADGGTIFLDEIGEIGPALQIKLLRVLQERAFERVGGEETLTVDVRVIAATNRDLQQLVAEGRFREDLYYRLHIVPIQIPPLRERLDDIEPLVRHFLVKLAGRTGKAIEQAGADALEVLRRYHWPGNVRELENVIEQAMVFAEDQTLAAADLPSNLSGRTGGGPSQSDGSPADLRVLVQGRPLPEVLDGLEKTLIEQAYQQAGKVKTEAARLLGIKTSALYYKLDKYGIE
jgi:two-component system response regulator HydG